MAPGIGLRSFRMWAASASFATALTLGAPAAAQVADTSKPAAPSISVKETVIAEMPAGTEVGSTYVNQEHTAWVLNTHGTRSVWLDGKQVGQSYDDATDVRLSRDGQHITWIAKRDGKWFALLDGVERTHHYGKMTAPALDANAKAILAGGCDGKRCHMLVDTVETGTEFEEISSAALTKDYAHVMYLGKRQGKWVMVLDDRERGPWMDAVYYYYFTAEGARTVVAGRVGDSWMWFVDTIPGPAFEVISPVAFSPDRAHIAYAGVTSQTTGFLGRGHHETHGYMTVDGHAGREYDGAGFGGGLAGINTIFTLQAGVRSLTADFSGVSDPIFTGDGKLVYAARLGKGDIALFIDSVAVAHYQDIVSDIVTSTDGKHLYFVARVGDDFADVLDQQIGTKVPVKERALVFVSGVVLSTDGSHHAYVIVRGGEGYKAGRSRRAERSVVLDGKPGPEFDAYGVNDLWFSDDGRHLAYVVVGASGDRDQLVFDHNIGRLYDWIYPASVKVLDDRNVEFTARDGNRWVRVLETVP